MSMHYRSLVSLSSLALLALGACGDDGGSGGGGAKAAASRSVSSAQNIKSAEDDASGDSALAGINALQADLQIIVQQQQLADLQARTGALTQAMALSADCVSQAGGVTTYTDCTVAPATMSGTVTVSGDTVNFDITGDIDPDAYNGPLDAAAQGGAGISITLDSVSFTESGNLTISSSAIEGTVNVNISLTLTTDFPGIGPQTSTQDTPIKADFDVDLDANGCAVGGSLTVTSGQTTATADYGPACGDVTLR
ncbi:MAG: hypothetical protein H6744_17810 [Deltaproteobacteria bacterium]|nr:hypothetical protein [Deltaproteobacteria bacterium]